DAKAAYLAGKERLALAKDTFDREKVLQQKNITSEKALFAARTEFAEARINVRLAEQKLNALGIDKERLLKIETEANSELTSYTMRSPISGVVINRHLVLGESVGTDREAFLVADVSDVWVDISIYPRDLPSVVAGLPAEIKTDTGFTATGTIDHVTPNVSEQTRTATARVIIDNKSGKFSPGMFVNAAINTSSEVVALRIPKSALQSHEGNDVVFINEHGAFEPRPVKLGRQNGKFVEVIGGLKPGELIVAEGAFVIKSQLSKESFDDGHNH
ncbi:MAG: efflux RND transporter periplasmic adaptor subunit, partial [Hyphomicrobiaceae bacterium]